MLINMETTTMKKYLGCAAVFVILAAPAYAQVKVGVIIGATGPGASLGIPYKSTFSLLPKTLGGQPVEYIQRDDATDPTNGVKFARDLIVGDKVDLIIGSSSTPSSIAIADVAAQLKTPQIALASFSAAASRNPWVFTVVQPADLMMGAVADDMKIHGVKSVAFIGFSDSWGDAVLSGFKAHAAQDGIKVVAEERYSRLDTSVVGQVLKVLSVNPDAVVVGGSGTPAALPQLTLREHGYTGRIYHNHATVGKDILLVGGRSWEGALAPTGPVLVADQLPDSNSSKKVSLEFTTLYQGTYGANSLSTPAAYSYDAYLLANRAVGEAIKKAKPGTPEFRQALRDALEEGKEVVGTHGVYNMTPTDHVAVDKRAVVMVHVENGVWRLVK
jgi:branched-chain amino acid transport system substrate-binding protein